MGPKSGRSSRSTSSKKERKEKLTDLHQRRSAAPATATYDGMDLSDGMESVSSNYRRDV